MDHRYYAELDSLCIRPLAAKDIELLRSWRNDEHISHYFRKIDYITLFQQQQWFQQYLKEPDIYYFTIFNDIKAIGALSLYDVKETEAEIGKFMIGDSMVHGRGYGYRSFIMALKIGFDILSLEKTRVTVHEKNIPARRIYEHIGFEVIGRHPFNEEGDELEMIIGKNTFKEANPMVELVRISDNWGGGYRRISKISLPSVFIYRRAEVA